MSNIIFIGLDVDDKAFHAHAVFQDSKEILAFVCKPSVSKLLEKLKEITPDLSRIKVCYEAGYLGFTLSRELRKKKRIEEFDAKIETIAVDEKYKEKVSSLICYRGFGTIATMTVIVEIGDITRFSHPRQLMGYAGLGIREHSSGGKEIKFGITKSGNPALRKTLIESSQKVIRAPAKSDELKRRSKHVHQRYIQIADRCMKRLNKKGMRMIMRGKHSNSAKTACAREMLGFVWESLMLAKYVQTSIAA